MIKKIKISGYRIYKQLILEPNPKLNLIVGGNEVGKSTLMEAIALALTGRINGKGANDELNPYWFNTELVADFVERRQRGENISLPEIKIELFFDNTPELQNLCGAINSDHPTNACPGVLFHVLPNSEYNEEIEQWLISPTKILPVEFYRIEWRSFADEKLLNRPRQLTTAIIDSKTVRSSTSIDYHLRQIINDHLAPIERAKISLSYRQVKASMAGGVLGDINER
ncbi:TPA: AAA family ATPase, partial [Enterobacter asburiae]|nr:AAA family ATPase [Enterobacter asburiae]